MEDAGNWLYLLLIVGGSLISWIIKAVKKQPEGMNIPQVPESFLSEEEVVEDSCEPPFFYEHYSPEQPLSTNTTSNIRRFDIDRLSYEEALFVENANETEEDEFYSEDEPVFDTKQAIIYSEILNRKYN